MIEVCCHESMVVFHLRVSNEWTTERMNECSNEWMKGKTSLNIGTATKKYGKKRSAQSYIPTEGESNDWIKMNYDALHISHSKSYYLNELT